MKTKPDFQTFFGRKNVLKTVLLNGFVNIASFPRLLLEVFIRRNFGERYFKRSSVVTLAFFLAIIPLITYKMTRFVSSYRGGGNDGITDSFGWQYGTWYLFLALFLYHAWLRWKEVKALPSIFELARFSKYKGDINPVFYTIRLSGKKPGIRRIEIIYEPAVFFIAGLFLYVFGQALGIFLIVTSICYALSYAGAYMQADEILVDMLDDILIKQELHSVIVGDQPPHLTKGVSLDARLPESPEHRQKLYNRFMGDDDDNISVAV